MTNITCPQVNFPDVEKVEWLNKVHFTSDLANAVYFRQCELIIKTHQFQHARMTMDCSASFS